MLLCTIYSTAGMRTKLRLDRRLSKISIGKLNKALISNVNMVLAIHSWRKDSRIFNLNTLEKLPSDLTLPSRGCGKKSRL
jgi:hypothetical protein